MFLIFAMRGEKLKYNRNAIYFVLTKIKTITLLLVRVYDKYKEK